MISKQLDERNEAPLRLQHSSVAPRRLQSICTPKKKKVLLHNSGELKVVSWAALWLLLLSFIFFLLFCKALLSWVSANSGVEFRNRLRQLLQPKLDNFSISGTLSLNYFWGRTWGSWAVFLCQTCCGSGLHGRGGLSGMTGDLSCTSLNGPPSLATREEWKRRRSHNSSLTKLPPRDEKGILCGRSSS